MQDIFDTESQPLTCPYCEVYELRPCGHNGSRCESCGRTLGGPLLQTLRRITKLPDAIGRHACECGHPEMRRLPEGLYRCPACGSEVLPASRTHPAVIEQAETRSKAYWCGWLDGRYGASGCFTENHRLAEWEAASDRLDYYRGHRAGRETRRHSSKLLEAS